MLSPLFVSTSGVTAPLFLAKPLLNLQTVQAHLFRQSPYVFIFHESPLKIRFFSETKKKLKFFIFNPILSFKSN